MPFFLLQGVKSLYKALYRKYRPMVFDDVVGQQPITQTLKNEIENNRFSHAYLFTGSRGTGKTTCAKILAKAINCENLQFGDPCLKCEVCKGIEQGDILDIIEIDAASNNGVDNIRQLRDEANFTPVRCKYRVYIIDEVHMLSTGAFNALLKIMEEPPEHVVFILATTEVHKIPATILSRCQRFDFRRIQIPKIKERLLAVAEQEKIKIDSEAAELLARLADGGMRDALSLLDKCAITGERITAELVRELVGILDNQNLFDLFSSVAQGDTAKVLTFVDEMYNQSKDMRKFCEDFLQLCRNVLVIKTCGKECQLINCDEKELHNLELLSQGVTPETLLGYMDILSDCKNRLSRAVFAKTEVEMCLLKLCQPNLASEDSPLLARVRALEDQMKLWGNGELPAITQPKQPSPKNNSVAKNAPPSKQEQSLPQKTQEKKEIATVQGFEKWPEVVEKISKSNPALYGTLVGSRAFEQGDVMLIDATDEMFLKLVRENEHAKECMRQALKIVTGKTYRLGPYKQKNTQKQAEEENPLDAFLNDAAKAGIPIHEK